MPELPDVESFRTLALRHCLDEQVSRVSVPDPASVIGATAATVQRRLKDRRLIGAGRHGKYLFLDFGDSTVLAMHFGPAGMLRDIGAGDEKPDYLRFLVEFSNGTALAYVNRRRIGRVRLIKDVTEFITRSNPGPDAIDSNFDVQAFAALLAGTARPVKIVMTDQKKMAGIGNTWSDEILFQARINPATPAKDISDQKARALFRTMRHVLREAIKLDPAAADFRERLPASFLLPHRHPGGHCPRCGTELARVALSGHTSTFCPRCQPQARSGERSVASRSSSGVMPP